MNSPLDIRIAKPVEVIRPDEPAVSPYDRQSRRLYAAYGDGDHETACKVMLEILHSINADARTPDATTKAETARAIGAVVAVFAAPDFLVPESMAFQFLYFTALIGNAMAGSLETTTDPWVGTLRGQKQEAFKRAVLTSARNKGQMDIKALMGASPELASAWFCQTFKQAFSANVNPHAQQQLIRMAKEIDDRFIVSRDIQEPYFLVTYLGDVEAERNCKSVINNAARKVAPEIRNGTVRKVVGVCSEYWIKGHSVHRTLNAYIESLRAEYELILFHSIRDAHDLDTSLFDKVVKLPYDGLTLDTTDLNGHGLAAMIYPDIGMTGSSILMANMRVAPVQVMMTGHPVSTFGSEIDYFISGELTERDDSPHYTEKRVRLSGYGAIHDPPTYVPTGAQKTFDGVLINCSWYGQKMSWQCLETVNEAVKAAGKPVKLRIFSGNAPVSHNGFAAFMADVGRLMPDCNVELVPHLPYAEYMRLLEEGDFAVDVFPFAGSNTVSDNLHLRKPVLILEGDRWYNRIGGAMMRACGLGSLVVDTEERFKDVLIDMITYEHVRDRWTKQIESVDLNETVYHRIGGTEFLEFLNHAIQTDTPAGTVAVETAIQDQTK